MTVEETQRQAELIAKQIVAQSTRALARGPDGDPREALRTDPELRNLLEASVGYSPSLLYVLVADRSERVILHSQSGKEGERLVPPPSLSDLLSVNPVRRFDALLSRGRTYETAVAISLDRQPFGSVRLGVSTSLLRRELTEAVTQSLLLAVLALPGAWLLALFLANRVMRPIGLAGPRGGSAAPRRAERRRPPTALHRKTSWASWSPRCSSQPAAADRSARPPLAAPPRASSSP